MHDQNIYRAELPTTKKNLRISPSNIPISIGLKLLRPHIHVVSYRNMRYTSACKYKLTQTYDNRGSGLLHKFCEFGAALCRLYVLVYSPEIHAQQNPWIVRNDSSILSGDGWWKKKNRHSLLHILLKLLWGSINIIGGLRVGPCVCRPTHSLQSLSIIIN